MAVRAKVRQEVQPWEYALAILLPPVGMVMGVLGARKGEPKAGRMMAVSGASSMVLSAAMFLSMPSRGGAGAKSPSIPAGISIPNETEVEYRPMDLRQAATVVTTREMLGDPEKSRDPASCLDFGDWSPKRFEGKPFELIDPVGDTVPNAIMLFSNQGTRRRGCPSRSRCRATSDRRRSISSAG